MAKMAMPQRGWIPDQGTVECLQQGAATQMTYRERIEMGLTPVAAAVLVMAKGRCETPLDTPIFFLTT